LAKCLLNYSNHAARTNRKDQALQFRERAASLFDTLNEDAAFRTTYISVMIRNDQLLVADYRERGQREKAIARLSNILSLNAILLERDKTITRLRADQADTHTRRAELWEQGGKHAEAARDYRAAAEYSTHPNHRDYCSARHVQALVRAGELNKAAEEAGKLKPDDLSHPFPCIELARGWLMIAAQRKKTSDLKDEELKKAVDDALEGAKNAVRAAEKKNWFKEPAHVREFHSQRDFEPLWDMIPRIPE
jgi:tetratricopeptide (TPR) repeat protein